MKFKSILKYLLVSVVSLAVGFLVSLNYLGDSTLSLKQLIKHYYIEDVDENTLNEGAQAGMVAALGDEHSVFINSEYGYNHFEGSVSGHYSGIGATLQAINKKAVIVKVHENSPAEDSGLKVGDIIVSVDDISAKGKTLNEVSGMLLGESGTTVKVKISRDDKELGFTLTRREISIRTIAYEKLTDDIGYIRIDSFDSDTDQELISALGNLQDCKKLIIDVRNNPGGYMDIAVNIVDLFVDDGIIVTAKYKNNKTDYPATSENNTELSDDFLLKTPMVVLVNENSASASEIFSAALKDHKRAKIVGVNTYGKGSIQGTFELKNNTGVKLTVGHFYSPNGTKINKVGVTPDKEVLIDEQYQNIDIAEIPRKDDLQLTAAITLLNEL